MTPNFATKGHQKHRLKKYKVFRNYNANLVIIFELTKFPCNFFKNYFKFIIGMLFPP